MDTADVVIVGGGIVGSAAAYFLGTDAGFRGRRIAIVERDPSYRESSTARSAGGIRQQFSTPENIAMSQFTLAMFNHLKTIFGADADVAFREQGYLIMATAEGRPLLAGNVELQRSTGADVVLLDASEIAARFPWLATADIAAAGLGLTGEGWFDPMSLANLFRKAALARGAIVINDRVTGLALRNARVESVALAAGSRIACGQVVNAAGCWAGEVAALAGLRLPVEPRKRYVYVIDARDVPDALRAAPLTVDPSGVCGRRDASSCAAGRRRRTRSHPRETWTPSTTASSRTRSGRRSPRACPPSKASRW
jgi:glycine/D-amino acid oxidase-like deaminating enzyme